jgi:hypothetical protein
MKRFLTLENSKTPKDMAMELSLTKAKGYFKEDLRMV